MKNIDYENVTEEMCNNFALFSSVFGEFQIPSKYLDYLFKSEINRRKMWDKYLIEKEKFDIKVKKAIDSMPHGKLWQMFHSRIWSRIQQFEKDLVKTPSQEESSLISVSVPVVVDHNVETMTYPSDLS